MINTQKRNTQKIIQLTVILSVLLMLFVAGCSQDKNTTNKATNNKSIKIGFIGPLTGDLASLGQNSKAAVEIAVKEINAQRGVQGKQIEIIFEDGKCNSKESASAANKLMNIDKVPVIIGGHCSPETLAAAPIAERTKTVMISPCSSHPDITNAGDYIFRAYPSDTFQGKYGA